MSEPLFNVVLVAPEIPPNTGNVIRLCANTGCALHLVEPLGFSMEDRLMKRAGLDYHEYATVRRHASWAALLAAASSAGGNPGEPAAGAAVATVPRPRVWAIETGGTRRLGDADLGFARGDWLVFGCETRGLNAAVLADFAADTVISLPMRTGQRSLNLSNAVAVTVFEGWRQLGYAGASAA